MLNFFRKIRKKLAADNKFGRYTRYAIGEVALIMLGIFMALQLQNWNEKRKLEIQFKSTLEQIYTAITYESENTRGDSLWFKIQAGWVDEFLTNPNQVMTDSSLVFRLHYLAKSDGESVPLESSYYAQQLDYDKNNKEQKELSKEILSYINKVANAEYQIDPRLSEELDKVGLGFPEVSIKEGADYIPYDSTFYDAIDIKNFRDLINSRNFRAILKNVRTFKHWNSLNAKNLYLDSQSIKALIEDYYPEVKLIINNVGIIGSAINGWDKSTPMTLFDKKNSIWEIEIFLNVGDVKFRCRDSWAQNWGGYYNQTFPKGTANFNGYNIAIPEAGNYRVVLNLSNYTYEFIKLDD